MPPGTSLGLSFGRPAPFRRAARPPNVGVGREGPGDDAGSCPGIAGLSLMTVRASAAAAPSTDADDWAPRWASCGVSGRKSTLSEMR